jgi:acyl-CoA thioesterase-1
MALLCIGTVLTGCGAQDVPSATPDAGDGASVDGVDAQTGEGHADGGAERGVEPLCCEEGSADGDLRQGAPLVVFMGTSLTEGLGLTNAAAQAWPARIHARAEAAGLVLRVRNAGLSGETSAGALRRVDWVLDEAPALFILETGANDGLRGLSITDLEANLNAIFERVRARFPETRLVLVGMEAPTNLGEGYAADFRTVFPRVAARWGADWIPFLLDGVAGVPSLNQDDRIHPTAEGHDRMAEVAWPVLGPLLANLARMDDAG